MNVRVMKVVLSTHDIASAVRGRRMELGVTQADLARRAGLSRKWVYDFESGKPSAELGRVLAVLDVLGLHLEVGAAAETPAGDPAAVDLDQLLEEYRRQ
jgi:y4mF family transcriptional regulator